ncbi:MAG TPA: hypothetical protein VK835_12060 [Bacteroidia bacterium]|nr:hypothetical protein [Bacteroidia bacterium]
MSNTKVINSLYVIVFITVALFSNKIFAGNKEDSTALKRKLIISVGIGDPALIYIDNFINNGYKFKSDQRVVPQVKPLYAKIEYRLFHHIGIGVDMSYDDYEAQKVVPSSTTYTTTYKAHTLIGDIRLNKHFHFFKKRLDFYLGAGVGYEIQSITNIIITKSLPKTSGNSIAFELTIGGRFYITKRVGIYIEGGIARSILQGGLAIRI